MFGIFSKILLIASILGAAPLAALTLKPQQEGIWLGPHLEILRDSHHALTLDDIRSGKYESEFFKQERDIPTFGYLDRNTYWARVTLENPGQETRTYYITSRYAAIDYLTVFSPQPDGRYTGLMLGDQVAFTARPIAYRFPIYPITVPPGQHTFYFWTRTTSSTQFPLTIASPRAFEAHDTRESIYLGLLCGACLVMMLYNFFIYIKFRSPAFLTYVLYILAYIVFVTNYQGLLQQFLFPSAQASWMMNEGMMLSIDFTCLMAYTFTLGFLHIREAHPRIHRLINILRVISVLNVINWLTLQTFSMHVTILNTFLLSFVLTFVGIFASLKKDRSARYYTVAWINLMAGNLTVLLAGSGLIPFNLVTSWSQFTGAAIEIILLSFALAARMAEVAEQREAALQDQHKLQADLIQAELEKTRAQESLLEEREVYIQNLDREVQNRTRDIRSILKAITQGIFMITPGRHSLEILPEYSEHLTHLLHRTDIAGQDPIDLIFRSTDLSLDQLDQIKNSLLGSLGSDMLGFELNNEHLVRELTFRPADGTSMHLEVDWNPIIGTDNVLEKVLVTLRDVTALRRLREQAAQHEKDLWITGELTTALGRFFPRIRQHAEKKMTQIEAILRTQGEHALDELWRQTLIFLHTLKGEARVSGFRIMANSIHEAESDLLDHEVIRNSETLMRILERVQAVLKSYRLVHEGRLGHAAESEERVFLSHGIAQKILDHLENQPAASLPFSQEEFRLFKKQLHSTLSSDLPTILDDQIADLKNLASGLQKSVPLVEFSGSHIRIPRNLHEPLSQVFGHLLQNSMDHGLESKEERLRAGKNPAGSIYIQVETIGTGSLRVVYRDDGRGLNLAAIEERARAAGWMTGEGPLDKDALANFIFKSGFSTRDQATLISGRGLGMDAVRSILDEAGGMIEVLLDEPNDALHYNFHFEMHLPLRPIVLAGVG
ncbi:7TM diverse intracellular signaling domain-containing protein [Oligoflexus tunisiensis]|uniref:7TM diverse intracellular signaling domain-containing protein n=1 Tax=Oligoflexus tunisiensis TaxID=708132 RepID=UPI00159F00DB|nr:7TM diverse intracellular signaling domain-containing protein [Oligoflexus tunisiensis]